jgi:hypothetical protein
MVDEFWNENNTKIKLPTETIVENATLFWLCLHQIALLSILHHYKCKTKKQIRKKTYIAYEQTF